MTNYPIFTDPLKDTMAMFFNNTLTIDDMTSIIMEQVTTDQEINKCVREQRYDDDAFTPMLKTKIWYLEEHILKLNGTPDCDNNIAIQDTLLVLIEHQHVLLGELGKCQLDADGWYII